MATAGLEPGVACVTGLSGGASSRHQGGGFSPDPSLWDTLHNEVIIFTFL